MSAERQNQLYDKLRAAQRQSVLKTSHSRGNAEEDGWWSREAYSDPDDSDGDDGDFQGNGSADDDSQGNESVVHVF